MTDSKAPTLASHLSELDPPDQVVESYAERLMDELFGGIERALEGDPDALETDNSAGTSSPEGATEPSKTASDLTLSFSEGGLPAVLLEEPAGSALPLSTSLKTASPESSRFPHKQGWQHVWTLNRLLLGAAGLSLVATLGLWLYQRQQVPVVVTVPTPATDAPPIEDASAEFAEYLRRSLDVLAQQSDSAIAAADGASGGIPNVTVGGNGSALGLPPIQNTPFPSLQASVQPTNGGAINVIERVYIPYQATPGSATSAPGASGADAPVQAAAPVMAHRLVGVLELGDRSAALFEIDGVTQRVYIGERVGSSDWSLVSVANEEAVIRRNGEVRSIYIGQQF